jgi:hypothetical protein
MAMLTNTEQMVTGGEGTRKNGLLSGRTAVGMLIFFGLALSMAFPYGLGLVVFVWAIVLTGALCAAGYACYSLVKDMFSKGMSFGYTPASAHMTGKKIKTRKKAGVEEEKKDIR